MARPVAAAAMASAVFRAAVLQVCFVFEFIVTVSLLGR
jgi:hypothetical protein